MLSLQPCWNGYQCNALDPTEGASWDLLQPRGGGRSSDPDRAAQHLHGHTRAASTAASAFCCLFLECFPRQVILLVGLRWSWLSSHWCTVSQGQERFLSLLGRQRRVLKGSISIQLMASLVLRIRDTGLGEVKGMRLSNFCLFHWNNELSL